MPEQQIQIKALDADLKAHYANMMQIAHGPEEFVLDFFSVFPPAGVLSARIVTSPGHLKRIVLALSENLKQYEDKFGKVETAEEPKNQIGFKTE